MPIAEGDARFLTTCGDSRNHCSMTIDPNSTLRSAIDTPEVHGGIDLVIDGIRKAQEAIDGKPGHPCLKGSQLRSLIERFVAREGTGLSH